MKKILIGLMMLSSFQAFGMEEEIKVTSFLYTGTRTRSAEICGVVKNMKGETRLLKVKVDPNSKKYATYFVNAAEDGKFCTLVMTYYGRANVFFAGSKLSVNEVRNSKVWEIE